MPQDFYDDKRLCRGEKCAYLVRYSTCRKPDQTVQVQLATRSRESKLNYRCLYSIRNDLGYICTTLGRLRRLLLPRPVRFEVNVGIPSLHPSFNHTNPFCFHFLTHLLSRNLTTTQVSSPCILLPTHLLPWAEGPC